MGRRDRVTMKITPFKYEDGKMTVLDQRKLPGEEVYIANIGFIFT